MLVVSSFFEPWKPRAHRPHVATCACEAEGHHHVARHMAERGLLGLWPTGTGRPGEGKLVPCRRPYCASQAGPELWRPDSMRAGPTWEHGQDST